MALNVRNRTPFTGDNLDKSGQVQAARDNIEAHEDREDPSQAPRSGDHPSVLPAERGRVTGGPANQRHVRGSGQSAGATCENPIRATQEATALRLGNPLFSALSYITPKLKAPRTPDHPKMPLTKEEIVSLVVAATEADKTEEEALILLMRYSGLSIRDAVTLRRDAIDSHNNLTLRRAKSGELVMIPLHSLAIKSLERIGPPNLPHFFWSARSQPLSATKYWRERLNLVASKAGVKNFTPHLLRHTFAVEFLIASKSIEDLSTLLGHSSVYTTERYYAQWNMARRDRLARIVREVHACDPLPELLNRRMSLKTTRGPRTRPPKSAPAPLPVMRSSSIR